MKSIRNLTGLLALATACSIPTHVWADPAAGSTWTEPTTGMEFVWIPSGCFNMGSTEGSDDEQPVHRVCVQGFYLGKYEVTQAQYQQVLGNNPSYFKGSDLPVEQVSWDDARNFLLELGAQSGNKLRLPTEAEWEYACRAGGRHDPFCGDGGISGLGWFNGNSDGKTHPVGGKRPNAWGLYDMSGNVWEWAQDCWHDSYEGAPTDGSAWLKAQEGNCSLRVVRGGSWSSSPAFVRSADRFSGEPSARNYFLGFRVARTLP